MSSSCSVNLKSIIHCSLKLVYCFAFFVKDNLPSQLLLVQSQQWKYKNLESCNFSKLTINTPERRH